MRAAPTGSEEHHIADEENDADREQVEQTVDYDTHHAQHCYSAQTRPAGPWRERAGRPKPWSRADDLADVGELALGREMLRTATEKTVQDRGDVAGVRVLNRSADLAAQATDEHPQLLPVMRLVVLRRRQPPGWQPAQPLCGQALDQLDQNVLAEPLVAQVLAQLAEVVPSSPPAARQYCATVPTPSSAGGVVEGFIFEPNQVPAAC